jgi:hypothetical protein
MFYLICSYVGILIPNLKAQSQEQQGNHKQQDFSDEISTPSYGKSCAKLTAHDIENGH